MLKVLHIIPRLSNAGPTRSLLAVVKALADLHIPITHRLISLDSSIHPFVALRVKKAGISILKQPHQSTLHQEIKIADIVQVHFWNHPNLYEFLHSDLPEMRLLFWFKVFGAHPPQVITEDLVRCADYCLTSSPGSLALSSFNCLTPEIKREKTNFALSPAELERLQDLKPQPHDYFNVGYIGTANFTKIHPRFVEMSAEVNIDQIRFIVCGGNDQELVERVQALGVSDRFNFRGYVEKIQDVLTILDVFGYPLRQDTYATSEQALQEAMYAGVPPVVFPYAGIGSLVEHQVTGLVVHTEKEYIQALELLKQEPELRQNLGNNAQKYAQEYFNPIKSAQTISQAYNQLMGKSKQPYRGLHQKTKTPSETFAAALGEGGKPFWTSLQQLDGVTAATEAIANSSNVLTMGEGGIFHYRNVYPNDPYLRLWSGLVLKAQQQQERAQAEFEAAIALGCILYSRS
jgi:glycosyltransferase involved in cell wall biosynthesis